MASGYRRKRCNWIKNGSNVIDRYGSCLSIYFFLSNLRKINRAADMTNWHIDKLANLIFYALTG